MNARKYTCRTVRNMLPLHVGGDLDASHVQGVDDHLRDCLSCFRELRELAAMRGRLGVLAEEPLPPGALDGFAEEVMARIAVGEPGPAAEPPRPSRPRLLVLPRLVAAAAVLVAGLAAYYAFEGSTPDGSTGPVRVTDGGRVGGQEPVVSRQPRVVEPRFDPGMDTVAPMDSGRVFTPPQGLIVFTPEQMMLLQQGVPPTQVLQPEGLEVDESPRELRERKR